MSTLVEKELLRCLLCNGSFTILDVQENNYLADTGICRPCYQAMKKSPDTCFGKQPKGGQLGYDEKAIECQEFCPDRRICKTFAFPEGLG